jgi:hypothetical protein
MHPGADIRRFFCGPVSWTLLVNPQPIPERGSPHDNSKEIP